MWLAWASLSAVLPCAALVQKQQEHYLTRRRKVKRPSRATRRTQNALSPSEGIASRPCPELLEVRRCQPQRLAQAGVLRLEGPAVPAAFMAGACGGEGSRHRGNAAGSAACSLLCLTLSFGLGSWYSNKLCVMQIGI